MGWCVRRVLAVSLVMSVQGGCAAPPRVTPAHDADALRATVRGAYEAVARGNEAAYRRLVKITPGDAYSDALTATMFESIRLHQVVEGRLRARDDADDASNAGSVAAAGGSLASSRPSALAAVDYRINARAMIGAADGWTFTVRGDRATIDELAEQPSAPTFGRVNDRWVLVPTPWDTPRDTATYRLMVKSERRLAEALAAARVAVANGSATSIEDVNARLRELLAEQTTVP